MLGDGADAGAKELCEVGAGIEDQGDTGGERIVGQGEPAPTAEPVEKGVIEEYGACLLYTSPSPRDGLLSRMPSSA